MKQPRIWTLREIDGKLCECYCMINHYYQTHHSKYYYKIVSDDNGIVEDKKGNIKTIHVVNEKYDPRVKKPRMPLYCKRKPTDRCYKNNCPYFAYCEYDRKEE